MKNILYVYVQHIVNFVIIHRILNQGFLKLYCITYITNYSDFNEPNAQAFTPLLPKLTITTDQVFMAFPIVDFNY